MQQRQIRSRDQDIGGVATRETLLIGRVGDRRRKFSRGQPIGQFVGVAAIRRQVTAMGVPESCCRVEISKQIDRIQRKVGDAVVLEGDVYRRHIGVGRRRQPECRVQNRHGAEHRQPFKQSTVGPVRIADQDEVDIGLVFRRQLAQL